MMAFLLAELREWLETRMRKALCLAACVVAIAALVGPLEPLLVAEVGAGISVIFGWAGGSHYGPVRGTRQRAVSFPASAGRAAGGKALSSLVLWLGTTLFLSPFLAASTIAWGTPAVTVASYALCWLAAYAFASGASFLSSLAFPGGEGLVGLLLYAAWFLASLMLEQLRPSNPLVQAWSIMKLEGGASPFLGIACELAAAAACYALAPLALASARRRGYD